MNSVKSKPGGSQLPPAFAVGLSLSGICGSGRNDWLVDIPLPEEGGYSLSLSGIAPQPDSSRGLEACIPSPYREHAAETDVFL
jgi:hypothetical protein